MIQEISRCEFQLGTIAGLTQEVAFSERAPILGDAPPGNRLALNANENPDGVPEATKTAVQVRSLNAGATITGRFQLFRLMQPS